MSELANPMSVLEPYLDPEPLMVIISGPSGVGKDSVVNGLLATDHPFYFVVTATDRPIRDDEVDGVDYFFYSTQEFEAKIERGEFFEYALVYDQWKGVPKEHILKAFDSGMDIVMRLDFQGVQTMQDVFPDAVYVFVAPPSAKVLEKRLRDRGTDHPDQLAGRQAGVAHEMTLMETYDYVVINHQDRLDEAVDQIMAIIAAEKCRIPRRIVNLDA